MKEIPLTRGKVALVDDEDYVDVSRFKWYAHTNYRVFYAIRNITIAGKRKAVKLHRYIMRAPDGVEVDHLNGDGLDCQRANMRLCSRSENQQNTPAYRGNGSGFKGVERFDGGEKWRARIRVDGKQRHLGLFNSKEDAARTYDVAARLYFGEHARLNFPEA